MSDQDGLAGRLVDGDHELVQRVYFEDTDFSGRIYHARYLHFLERGRSDYLRLVGVRHRDLWRDGIGFVVRRMTLDFLKAGAIDDVIVVRTACQSIRGARVTLAQTARRGADDLVRATVEIAQIGPNGRPLRLPDSIRSALQPGASSPLDSRAG